ncbi:helix-turn-helix domain-containing protein [Tellurirhabdus rosea]|uniref:helix-turn-helix domain-containing protein n=1 Tax=Tellurirhabdus rosea TaxID=2674997 RepID=UPI00224F393B|nr:helix-turn-helix domain-containing protein [Tellurirhabdus rosea]
MAQSITFEQMPKYMAYLVSMVEELKREVTHLRESSTTPQDELLTIEEASAYTNRSVATLYKDVQNRSIPFAKRGNRLLFSKSALYAWMIAGTIVTVEDATEAKI